MEHKYQNFFEVKEWTNTMIAKYGQVIIACANDKAEVIEIVKEYKSALTKLQRCLSNKIKETNDKQLKKEYKQLHQNIIVLNRNLRSTLL
jgi:hypothetical protein